MKLALNLRPIAVAVWLCVQACDDDAAAVADRGDAAIPDASDYGGRGGGGGAGGPDAGNGGTDAGKRSCDVEPEFNLGHERTEGGAVRISLGDYCMKLDCPANLAAFRAGLECHPFEDDASLDAPDAGNGDSIWIHISGCGVDTFETEPWGNRAVVQYNFGSDSGVLLGAAEADYHNGHVGSPDDNAFRDLTCDTAEVHGGIIRTNCFDEQFEYCIGDRVL